MLFGEKVKQLRKEKGLTQTELAEAVGVTLRTVQNYEGKNLFPKNQDVVNKLCCLLIVNTRFFCVDIATPPFVKKSVINRHSFTLCTRRKK